MRTRSILALSPGSVSFLSPPFGSGKLGVFCCFWGIADTPKTTKTLQLILSYFKTGDGLTLLKGYSK
jgi:hypothetical protein